MAAPSSNNIHAGIATYLSHQSTLSEEQKIFQDAFHKVLKERQQNGKLPEVFDNLRHAQTVEDVQLALFNAKSNNVFWTRDIGRAWMKRLGTFAECMLQYKPLIDTLVPRSQNIAAPIWGASAFVLGVFKDLSSTITDLKIVEEELEQATERFPRYLDTRKTLSPDLKLALRRFCEVVLVFAVEMHGNFEKSRITSIVDVVHRKVKEKIDELNKSLHKIIYAVDQGGLHDRMDDHKFALVKLTGALQATHGGQSAQLSQQAPSSTRGLAYGLPRSNKAFSGQKNYLSTIHRLLHSPNDEQKVVSLYGMGGIGKSQIVQKYAKDCLRSSDSSGSYDIVLYIHANSRNSIYAAISAFMRTQPLHVESNIDFEEDDGKAFLKWMLSHQNWLLILDNVKQYSDISPFLPHNSPGHIICTTRHQLIARQVASDNAHALEILSMDEKTCIDLIHVLVRQSSSSISVGDDSARDVATFARGIPLVIEQIVHNSIFSHTSLRSALQAVQHKRTLLKQSNKSSLHEDNLSLGAVVMQHFEDIRNVSDCAEALFTILAYMEPSAIPLSLIREGSQHFNDYLYRNDTYDRGYIDESQKGSRKGHYTIDPTPKIKFFEEADPWHPSTWSSIWNLRSNTRKQTRSKLPVDDANTTKELRELVKPDGTLGRLFTNAGTIDAAIITLRDITVVRNLDGDTLWMHDLVSETTQALIEDQTMDPKKLLPLVAATMVYLVIPTPRAPYVGERQFTSERCLPHMIAAQKSLKNLGILNDSSIGPELSHTIASILLLNRTWGPCAHGRILTSEERQLQLDAITNYYIDAYRGYMSGWHRLRNNHNISDHRILLATVIDNERQPYKNNVFYGVMSGNDRYGRSAPWRAVQTALKLSYLLEQRESTLDLAIRHTRAALRFYELAFGVEDDNTFFLHTWLFHQLGPRAQKWDEAYTASIGYLKDRTGWNGDLTSLRMDSKQLDAQKAICGNRESAQIAEQAGRCRVESAKRLSSQGRTAEARVHAEEASILLRLHAHDLLSFFGPDPVIAPRLVYIAMVYEMAEDYDAALTCFALAAIYATTETGARPWIVAASMQEVLPVRSAFLDAVERLKMHFEAGGFRERLGRLIDIGRTKMSKWAEQQSQSIVDPLDDLRGRSDCGKPKIEIETPLEEVGEVLGSHKRTDSKGDEYEMQQGGLG